MTYARPPAGIIRAAAAAIVGAALVAGGALASEPEPDVAAPQLNREQRNLAYCYVVLTDTRFGGRRDGENDLASADVLRQRLAHLLALADSDLDGAILPSIEVTVAVETEARGKPRFSPTACAGYAHFIKTTPLP